MPRPEDNEKFPSRKSFEDVEDDEEDENTRLKRSPSPSGSQQDYDDTEDEDYASGSNGEDSRAILLQEMGGRAEGPTLKRTVDFDPLDDSPAAMVHRVRPRDFNSQTSFDPCSLP